MRRVIARIARWGQAGAPMPTPRYSKGHAGDRARPGVPRECGVAGKAVAVAGELTGWPSRRDVRNAIDTAGGRYVGVISHRVDVVVFGSPADDDDAAAATILRARKMADAGRDVQIIDEAEFAALIGYPNRWHDDPLARPPSWGDAWPEWGPPVDGVVGTEWYVREFVRLLGPRRVGGYLEPRDVVLFCHRVNPGEVEIVVECRGIVVGRLPDSVASRLSQAMDVDFLDRVCVPAVLYGGAAGDAEGFSIGLWPERAATSDEIAGVLATLGPRIDPWPPDWN